MHQMYYIIMIYVQLTTKMFFLMSPLHWKNAIEKLKSGKAAGIDRICNEILNQPLF